MIFTYKYKNSSRVPRYQNPQKIGGSCNLLFASPYLGGLGGSAPLLVRFLGASEKMNKLSKPPFGLFVGVD